MGNPLLICGCAPRLAAAHGVVVRRAREYTHGMVRAASLLALVSFAMVAGGCSQAATTVETAAPSQTSDVVIAQIVTHDAKVAILGGGRDLRVVVRKIDGTMVADGLSLAELRTRDPELYLVVTSAFASSTPNAPRSTYVDATLDLGHIN